MIRRRRAFAVVVAAALLGLGAVAVPPIVARAEMEDYFYPPELIQAFGKEAEIPEEKLAAIKKDVRAAQLQMVDADAKLKRTYLELDGLLADDATPIEAILQKIDALGAAETELKKLHIGLLVRIRRSLTKDERWKLDAWKPELAKRQKPEPPRGDDGGGGGDR